MIGVSEFLRLEIGDVLRVILPQAETEVDEGDGMFSIWTAEEKKPFPAPFSGLIAEGLSGVSYFRYATGDYNNSEESGFHLDRAYFTFKKSISDKSSFKFQSDIQNKGEEAYYMFIKKAHMT